MKNGSVFPAPYQNVASKYLEIFCSDYIAHHWNANTVVETNFLSYKQGPMITQLQ